MIRSLAILHRRPDVTSFQFLKYWKEVHGGIVVKVPGLQRFRQNVVLANELEGVSPFVLGELIFPSGISPVEAFETDEGRACYASGANVIDQPRNHRLVLEQAEPMAVDGADMSDLPAFRVLRFSRLNDGAVLEQAAAEYRVAARSRRDSPETGPVALYAIIDHNLPEFDGSIAEEYCFKSVAEAILTLGEESVLRYETSTSGAIDRSHHQDLIFETYADFKGERPEVVNSK
jgi:uncharacterized protein (TIGR02118 family)